MVNLPEALSTSWNVKPSKSASVAVTLPTAVPIAEFSTTSPPVRSPITGASLLNVTSSVATPEFSLNAPLGSNAEMSTLAVPLGLKSVWSQTWKTSLPAGPKYPGSGTNRISAFSSNSNALVSSIVPFATPESVTEIQVVPPSIEYSQLPFASSAPTIAMPAIEPVSTSVTMSDNSLATVSPAGSTSFLSTSVSWLEAPPGSKTGASFTGLTNISSVSTLSLTCNPS